MTTIFVVDEEPLNRCGVRSALVNEADLEVIGDSGDGLEALRLIKSLKPDIVMLDLLTPGMNGIELTRSIRADLPETHILVFSRRTVQPCVLQILRSGASGYFLKQCPVDDLPKAIRATARGVHYLSSPLADTTIESYIEMSEHRSTDPYEDLTERERQVLHLAAEGCSNKEIGEKLFLSPRTVEHHRESFMRKLGIKNQTSLVRFAIRRGLIPMDD